MRTMFVGVMIAALVSVGSAAGRAQQARDDDAHVGTWTGRWDGNGAGGGFDLTIEKGEAKALTGRVSVTGEPTYQATLKKLSFDGNKMTGAYDFTPNDEAEVILAATFEGNTAKGSWSLRAKADGTEVAAGTWSVTKK
jgi:hypothetical protein